MTQYINKAALIAEIERRRDLHYKYYMKRGTGSIAECKYDEDRDILSFIDTLEVKEVDLDEAARKWEDKVYLEKGWQDEYGTPHVPFSEIGNAFREGAKFILNAQKGE